MTVRSRQDAARISRYQGVGALLLVWTLLGSAAYARHLLFIERPSGNAWFEFATWLMSFYPWVLLDVQLHDCTGLEVVEKIGPQNMPPVVFVTAYDEYAVKAFELNAVDYLLKPFDDTRLQNSIERAIERISLQKHGQLVEKLQALLETRIVKWPERIVVRDGERFDLIPVASIEWIESANNYVQLHCGTKSYLLGESLMSLESRLDPVQFIRIHRGRIINVARVLGVRTMLSSTYEVELRSGTRLTTGRQYKDMVQMRLLR
jgi:two-component system LytT family response regulator